MKKFRNYLVLMAALLASTANGAKISDNVLKVGKPSSDVSIQLGDSNFVIKKDNTLGKLQFTNDGTNFKDIGSGSGGASGVNTLTESNADFENGTTSWTASTPAHLTTTTTAGEVISGKTSGQWDAAASSDTLTSALVDTRSFKSVQSKDCSVKFKYVWDSGVAGDIAVKVQDGNGTDLLADGSTSSGFPEVSPTSSGVVGEFFAIVPCVADSGTLADRQMKVVLEATADAAEITLDDFFLGDLQYVSESSAELISSAYYAPTANCQWDRTNTALGAFVADTDCPAITVEQSKYPITTTDNDLPDLVYPSLPPGNYLVEVLATGVNSSPGAAISFAVSDGTNTRSVVSINPNDANARDLVSMKAWFSYSSTGARTFSLFGAATAGSAGIHLKQALETLNFKVTRYPLDVEKSIPFDQADWHIDASIGGASINTGTPAQSSYVGLESGSLDIVTNSGSHPVKITCSGTNPPTGSTCAAGNESVGGAFTISRPGDYRACASFTTTHSVGTDVVAYYQLVETPIAAQTISQIGKEQSGSGGTISSGDMQVPHKICGTFQFTSAGEKAIRVFYKKPISTTNAPFVSIDRSATLGDRDLHFEVYRIGELNSSVSFKNVAATPSNSSERIARVSLAGPSGGSCAITSQSGSWISGTPSSAGTGLCTLSFVAGTFSAAPTCVCTILNGDSNRVACAALTKSASGITTYANRDDASGSNDAREIICMGPR